MDFSYFVISLLIACLGVVILVCRPKQRPFILLSGLYAAPAGLGDVLFVPEYWMPAHVFAPWFSIEGVLCSFGNGCLIALLMTMLEPKGNFTTLPSFSVHSGRFFRFITIGLLAFLLFWQGAWGSLMIMHAAFVGFLIMVIFMFVGGHFRLKHALVGGVGFFLIYFVETLIWWWLDPEFSRFWSAEFTYWVQWRLINGLPIEEYLWAAFYGALWSCLMMSIIVPAPLRPSGIKQHLGTGKGGQETIRVGR
jgi:hypothetical protein